MGQQASGELVENLKASELQELYGQLEQALVKPRPEVGKAYLRMLGPGNLSTFMLIFSCQNDSLPQFTEKHA